MPAFLSFLLACLSPLVAQGVDPVGRFAANARPLGQVATLDVAPLDRPALAAEDVQRHQNGMPARYALPFAVTATPATHGSWDQLDQTWSLWRLRVRAPGADHVNLGFTAFVLPPAARVMVYAADYSHVVRPFDRSDAGPEGQLWTPVVRTAEVVVELYVPTAQAGQVRLELGQVGSGYRFFGAGPSAVPAAEPAGSCNVDVACPQSAGWQPEIPSVAAISSGGSIFCTGFMVNNTAQDGRNFFMTANHCGVTAGVAPSLVCYWNYQNSLCNGGTSSLSQFNTGATLRASWATSDFTLVELNSTPNPAWGVTYGGWDHSGVDATSATAIHHPSGDVKKISFEPQATQVTSYSGTSVPGDGTHVRIVDWDIGTTEPGSSGSPLFNQNHQVIGQLHGGGAACGNNLSDYYGRFAVSWTGGGTAGTRLSNWLDPLATGQPTLATRGSNAASASPYGAGCYQTFRSCYENFAAGGFDLQGSAAAARVLAFTRTATGYTVANGTSAWFAPTGANLGLGDDAVSAAQTLPFSFSFPGGATTQVRLCSNGYLWLDGTSTAADYTPTAGELLAGAARLAPFWMDLNPASIGTVTFSVDPTNTAVYCTWLGVPCFGTTTPTNDVQVVLRSNGNVEFRYRLAANAPAVCLVGFSPGGGAADPGSRDLSLSLPFATGADAAGLVLAATNRPVLGVTQGLQVQNIPAGSLLGAVFLGFQQFNPGNSLAGLGAPGCLQFVSLDTQVVAVAPASSFAVNVPIPASAAFAGTHVYTQAATLSAGVNALGALTSNGVDLKLDVQ